MQGLAAGLFIGIGCGMSSGMAIASGLGKAAVHNRLKQLIAEGGVSVMDRGGKALSAEEFTALLSSKCTKG